MPLLTIDQCRSQCRVADGQDDDALLVYLDAATDAAQAYLNRSIFADAETLNTARQSVPNDAATAAAAHSTATVEAQAETNPDRAAMLLAVAEVQFAEAERKADWTINGIASNPSILAAVRLTLGHLFDNRASVVVDSRAAAVEVPYTARALLLPYRRVQMP